MKNYRLFVTGFVLIFAVVLLGAGQAAVAEVDEPEAVSSKPIWQGALTLTSNANGSFDPVVASAPNSKQVAVAYLKQESANDQNTDPFYRKSTNNGQTWAGELTIRDNPNTETKAVDIAFDSSNRLHAVWLEVTTTGGNETFTLYHANESNWANRTTISSVTEPTTIISPKIVVRGSTVDVVWAEGELPTLYYRRFNGSWGLKTAMNAGTFVRQVDLTRDASSLYVVWEDVLTKGVIHYAKGTPSGTSATWAKSSTPISNVTLTGSDDGTTPEVAVGGGKIHVSFVNRKSANQQFAHYISCNATSNCTQGGNWQNAVNGNPINGLLALGLPVGNPDRSVNSTIALAGNCAYVYYYGTSSASPDREQIRGQNSCGGWTASASDVLATSGSARYIHPSMTDHNGWYLYVAYEEIVTVPQVKFVRNRPAIYLPIILKQ